MLLLPKGRPDRETPLCEAGSSRRPSSRHGAPWQSGELLRSLRMCGPVEPSWAENIPLNELLYWVQDLQVEASAGSLSPDYDGHQEARQPCCPVP